jgi:hypothetical protein
MYYHTQSRIFFFGKRKSENEAFHSQPYPNYSEILANICFALFLVLSIITEVREGHAVQEGLSMPWLYLPLQPHS